MREALLALPRLSVDLVHVIGEYAFEPALVQTIAVGREVTET